MSSPDRASGLRLAFATILAAAMSIAAGCTVQPLHGSTASFGGSSRDSGLTRELASVDVAPVATREAQQVRNHLIFLFGGGRGTDPDPRYALVLDVAARHEVAAQIQHTVDDEPTSQIVTMTVGYTLTDNRSGEPVATGSRATMAAYDLSRQEFAALRARRDAEDRAAREVAELVRMAVAQALSRRPAGS